MQNSPLRTALLTIVFIVGFHAACHAETASNNNLNTPHTLKMMETPLGMILIMEPAWKPLQIDVDPDLLSKLMKDGTECTISIHNVEMRYLLGWLIHFADANATVRDDGSIFIAGGDKLKQSDPIFECYKETEGKWFNELKEKLNGKSYEIKLTDASLSGYLKTVHLTYGLPLIIDPLVRDDYKKAKVTIHGGTEGSCGGQLAFALKQTGLTYKLQGGVVFITK